MGLAFALALAVLAERAGSAIIIGAFAAGLVLARTPHAHVIRKGTVRIGVFFVPVFFVAVGAAVDVRTFANLDVLVFGLALIGVGIVGKVAAGYAPWWFSGRKLVIGVAMVPRGEVGLIFAQTGLTAGVLDDGRYAALTLMVLTTTLLAPPVLRALLQPKARSGDLEQSGVAELTTEA
jgi:Kef-type K+ transport system membrane component KefB